MNSDRWEELTKDEFGEFERIPADQRPSKRADLCAFIYLDKKFNPKYDGKDFVCSAEYDEIFLDVSEDQVESLTDEDAIYLSRCGMMYNSQYDCLSMLL